MPCPEFHLLLVSPNPALKALRPPYPGAKTLKLDDLTVMYKKIHARAVILDVPGKDFRIGGFEHYVLQPEPVRDPRYDISPPDLDAFGDPLGFDHDYVSAGIERRP